MEQSDPNLSDQQPDNPVTQFPETKPKTPTLVAILGWLTLLGGIGQLAWVIFLIPEGIKNIAFFVPAIFLLVGGLIAIIVSFGLLNMRRWALYVFTGLTLLGSIDSFLTAEDSSRIGVPIIGALILLYLWLNRKKFV